MTSREFKRIRSRLRKFQREIAEDLGISRHLVTSIEQEKRKVPRPVSKLMRDMDLKFKNGRGEPGTCWSCGQEFKSDKGDSDNE